MVLLMIWVLILLGTGSVSIIKENIFGQTPPTTLYVTENTANYSIVIDCYTGDTWIAYKTSDDHIVQIEKIYRKNGKPVNWKDIEQKIEKHEKE